MIETYRKIKKAIDNWLDLWNMFDNNFIVFNNNWIFIKWNTKWWMNSDDKIIAWEVKIEPLDNILKLIS